MKKLILMLIVAAMVAMVPLNVSASNPNAPAPNSGDGISDGSGFEAPPGAGNWWYGN